MPQVERYNWPFELGKDFFIEALDLSYGLPGPQVLLDAVTGPYSDRFDKARRELLMRTAFVGVAFDVRVRKLLPNPPDAADAEALMAYFGEKRNNQELIDLCSIAREIGKSQSTYTDQLIKNLDNDTWKIYESFREHVFMDDLNESEGEGEDDDYEADDWLVPDDLPDWVVTILAQYSMLLLELPEEAIDDDTHLTSGAIAWATFIDRWGGVLTEKLRNHFQPGFWDDSDPIVVLHEALVLAGRVADLADAVPL